MELKRILARDTRSATDKAIALYGPDVLIISNHQVGGQTELVVALDVQPEPARTATVAPAPATAGLDFRDTFLQAQQAPAATAAPVQPAPAQPAALAANPLLAATATHAAAPAALPPQRSPEDARDLQRGREIVDLVRDEIAALRREFRLTQQAAAWQGGLQIHPALEPLVEALNECQVPTALRSLLMDALPGMAQPQQALTTWRSQLEHSLARPAAQAPLQGVQVLAGPSGGGKTLMCARLARHASQMHGAEQVALISYRDQRAGAWSQLQVLAAQLGVDCFRAHDDEALRLLLSELSPRALVVVDTPGVEMAARLAEVQAVAPQAACHAVVPADASGVTLRRVLVEAGVAWQSIMVSKLDEASAPWPLLQLISNNELLFSCASHGNRMTDLIHAFTLPQLVDLALAPLARATGLVDVAKPAVAAPTQASASPALAVAHA